MSVVTSRLCGKTNIQRENQLNANETRALRSACLRATYSAHDRIVPPRPESSSGAGNGCLVCLCVDRCFSVLVADYDHTISLPVFFTCRIYVGARRAQQMRELTSEPSDSPAHCSSQLPPTSYLTSYTYLIYSASGFFGKQEIKQKKSHKGQTCTLPPLARAPQLREEAAIEQHYGKLRRRLRF